MQTLSKAFDILQVFIRKPCNYNKNPTRKNGCDKQIIVENLLRLITDVKQLSFTQIDKKIVNLGKTHISFTQNGKKIIDLGKTRKKMYFCRKI